jgi:hypothetical protein
MITRFMPGGEYFAFRKAHQHDRENFLNHGQKCNK